MIAGMATGVVVLAWVWWTAAAAWTWWAFIGSSVTFAAALAASFVLPESESTTADVPVGAAASGGHA